MDRVTLRKTAFAMPLTSPAFPPGPYRFIDREYLIITYRTDKEALDAVVPELLTFDEPLVKYEFIRIPRALATTRSRVRSFRSRTRVKKAATRTPCSSMTDRRSTAAASYGAFLRSTRSPRWGPTRTR